MLLGSQDQIEARWSAKSILLVVLVSGGLQRPLRRRKFEGSRFQLGLATSFVVYYLCGCLLEREIGQ